MATRINQYKYSTIFLCVIIASLISSIHTYAATPPLNCTSAYKNSTLTQTKLNAILQAHQSWLKSNNPNAPGKANLCQANLSGLNLSNRDLRNIDFSGADLSKANLSNANLEGTDLRFTYFRWATLRQAKLNQANLMNANFEDANLNQASLQETNAQHSNFSNSQSNYINLRGSDLAGSNFTQANLSNAILSYTTLTNADFTNATLASASLHNSDAQHANFTNANLDNSDLSNVILVKAIFMNTNLNNTDLSNADINDALFQPLIHHLPNLIALTTTLNLDKIRFHDNHKGIAPLSELRTAYKKLGIRSMERKITSIIKFNEMRNTWNSGGWGRIESAFSYIMFYITCHYGSNPGRALRLFVMFVLLFSIPYYFSLIHASKRNGILVKWIPRNATDKQLLTRMITKQPNDEPLAEAWRLWRIALFFSLVSAFSVGWREFNIGNWLYRLQAREYNLKGKGWVRVLAGSQALISAYLIVLWALTYFGRPFEW